MSQAFLRPFFVLSLIFGGLDLPPASAPSNDNFANAAAITSLPMTWSLDASEATVEPEEPQNCLLTDRTVWYSFEASEAAVLMVDTLITTGTAISVYRAAGPGFADLEFIQCIGWGAVTFFVEPGQRYYIQAGAVVDFPGEIGFSLSELTAIYGKVTDAVTGASLAGNVWPFTWARLDRVCGEGCTEFVASVTANANGRFWFDSSLEIPTGTYMIQVFASLYPLAQVGPFEYSGGNLDVGEIALHPLPTIRSIRGRLLDHVTGKPVSPAFYPTVYLYRCHEPHYCSEFVASQQPDAEGRFRFETDSYGHPLPIGTYQVSGSAEQYHIEYTQTFEVAEGGRLAVGTVRMHSFPIRFSEVTTCPDIPAGGGECAYSVRVWNGLGGTFEGAVWNMADGSLPNTIVGRTYFQVKEPQKLMLERGKSKILHFRVKVPADTGSPDSSVCLQAFAGRGGNPLFNTVGFSYLFCIVRTPGGFAITPRDARTPAQAPQQIAAQGLEVEPNNPCRAAQEMGTVPMPFSMDGDLSSPETPDVDFYRFRGVPGESLVIDDEGADTARGTLADPLLGLFDSNCNLITYDDDNGFIHNARVIMKVPDDGVFILAATSFPDRLFVGQGGSGGTYRLTMMPFLAQASISGRVIDGISGAALPGNEHPYAFALLARCDDDGCFYINGQVPGDDGRFYFASDISGNPLGQGNYVVEAIADQYQANQTAPFAVGNDENVDVGDLALNPFPLIFKDGQICEVPSQGGLCEFSVEVTNPQATRFSGKAWSVIFTAPTGSFIGMTLFQTDSPLNINLEPGTSRTLRFRFRVRSTVPDGAEICSATFVGENPDAYFNPLGTGFSFCLYKGPQGFTLMPQVDAHEAFLRMQKKQFQDHQTFADEKK